MSEYIKIYTDGSGTTSGPYGWAFIAVNSTETVEHAHDSGAEPEGTCNVAELEAVIRALEWAQQHHSANFIHVYSDSKYVVDCFKQQWYLGWLKNKWRNSRGRKVANQKQWQKLLRLVDNLDVRWYHCLGHTGIKYNEWCDRAAKHARKEFIRCRLSAETTDAQTASL